MKEVAPLGFAFAREAASDLLGIREGATAALLLIASRLPYFWALAGESLGYLGPLSLLVLINLIAC